MADYTQLVPIIKKWEGGFVNDPDDSGGATNKGVTLSTFRSFYGSNKTVDDLKKLTDQQWLYIFLNGYWNKCKATEINNQSIANIFVDWAWGSGPVTAIKKIQKIVGTDVDGIVGPKTIEAINKKDPKRLFDAIKAARIEFVENLVKQRPKDAKFLKGWKARINSFSFPGSGGISFPLILLFAGSSFLIFKMFEK